MATTTKDIDRGARRIIKEIGRTKGSHVLVGIFAGAAAPDGGDVVQYAAKHEFGQYPFMRHAVDANLPKNRKIIGDMINEISSGKRTSESALTELGILVQGQVRNSILDGPWIYTTEQAAAALKRKGSTRPLVDTQTMVRSVKYKVVK